MVMNDSSRTSAIIDNLLRFAVGGGLIATIIIAPNAVQIFDGPLQKYLDKLDVKQRDRELKRIVYYMKQQGLVATTSEDYLHGLIITNKGKKRLKRLEFDKLEVLAPERWDGKWRMVIFDIPELSRVGRRSLIYKLKQIGFVQLQRSVWVHPFPCRQEVELVASSYDVQKYVSYVEATGIDSEHLLKKRFQAILK